MEHAQQRSMTQLTYDILGLAAERGRLVPLASALPVGGRKGVASTTSSYRGVETTDLPVEDPSLEESVPASRLASGGYLSGR
jgi:hypothetical protein